MNGFMKLKVVDYYGTLTSKIDFVAEKLINKDQSQEDQVNRQRCVFIEEIERAQRECIRNIEQNSRDAGELSENELNEMAFSTFAFFSDGKFDDEIDLEDENPQFKSIVFIDRYMSKRDFELCRELAKFRSKKLTLQIDNSLFELDETKSRPTIECNSNFELLFDSNKIGRVKISDMLKIDHLNVEDFYATLIKPEARFLFQFIENLECSFKDEASFKLADVISSIKLLESNTKSLYSLAIVIRKQLFTDSKLTSLLELRGFKRLKLISCKISTGSVILPAVAEMVINFCELVQFKSEWLTDQSKVVKLDLKNNCIDKIDCDMLSGLLELEELMLSGNPVGSIEPDAFKSCQKIKHLNLNNNERLTQLNSSMFQNLSSLTKLDLGYCQIREIEKSAFESLVNLEVLHLNKNELTSNLLSQSLFVNLSKLQELWLFRNQLDRISSSMFIGLNGLRKLNLSSNQITQIDSGSFDHLTNLQELLLNNNLITEIKPNTFKHLHSLVDLSLPSNRISTLNKDSFEGLVSLTKLNLERNELKSIDPDTFVYLPQLSQLILKYNSNIRDFTKLSNPNRFNLLF